MEKVAKVPVQVLVRVASLADTKVVEALLRASYPSLMAPGYPTDLLAQALPFMVRANPALLCSGTYYLAEEPEGTVIGCGGWTLERPGAADMPVDPTLGHIRHFATHPNWTRRGVGKRLLDRCTTDALATGVCGFECYSSLVAEAFYSALGFAVIEPVMVGMGPGVAFPSVRMIRRLPDRDHQRAPAL